MSKVQNELRDALKVMVLTPGIRAHLQKHDPKALEQAQAALAKAERCPIDGDQLISAMLRGAFRNDGRDGGDGYEVWVWEPEPQTKVTIIDSGDPHVAVITRPDAIWRIEMSELKVEQTGSSLP